MDTLELRPHSLTARDVVAVARHGRAVTLRAPAMARLAEARAAVDDLAAADRPSGSGDEVEREVVRAMMVLRLRTLISGHTGVGPVVAETLAAVLTTGITPVVHEHGSLGRSGDLAPLAAVTLTLIGEGQVRDADGRRRSAAEALAAAGIAPLELAAKEGLSLINGTDGCEATRHLSTVATACKRTG